jgi:hypothetical protein
MVSIGGLVGRHYRKALFGTLFFVVLAIPVGAELFSPEQLSEEAVSYIELLDHGRYAEAWQETSAHLPGDRPAGPMAEATAGHQGRLRIARISGIFFSLDIATSTFCLRMAST